MTRNRRICFDLDGTLVNFYGVDGWLDDLLNERTRPYEICKPLWNFSKLARMMNKAQENGNKIVIISWLSKNSSENFERAVTKAKLNYLKKHLPSVNFDEIHIVSYGTPKSNFGDENSILFDDEERNRNDWNGIAYEPNEIFNILEEMA